LAAPEAPTRPRSMAEADLTAARHSSAMMSPLSNFWSPA
jgi:hypothetical protein